MYEFKSRVRYSEVDRNCELKWSALVNYLQDCTTFHSEDLGLGVSYLSEKGLIWVLNYWQIDCVRLPKLGDNILIGTVPYEIKGFIGLRNIFIKDANTDEMLIKANSVWTLLDVNKGRPAKADDKMLAGYMTGDRIDMEYTDRKIIASGDPCSGESITIAEHMLDTNNHVNNEQYIELALRFIPKNKSIKRLRTEYNKSAVLGDILFTEIFSEDNEVTVLFKSSDNSIFAKCQFIF